MVRRGRDIVTLGRDGVFLGGARWIVGLGEPEPVRVAAGHMGGALKIWRERIRSGSARYGDVGHHHRAAARAAPAANDGRVTLDRRPPVSSQSRRGQELRRPSRANESFVIVFSESRTAILPKVAHRLICVKLFCLCA